MATQYETAFLNTLRNILLNGKWKNSRPGQRTLSSDTEQLVIDISNNLLPLLTTKQIFHKLFTHEDLWFISGSTNVKYLKDNNVNIWDSWVIPKTAVFEPCDKPSASDILTYIRCKLHASVFVAWTAYKDQNKVGIPKLSEVQGFIEQYTENHPKTPSTKALAAMPRVRLVSGEIGNGAYGANWRRWPELRTVLSDAVDSVKKLGLFVIGSAGLTGTADKYHVMGRHIDQLGDVVKQLRTNPDSRRIIVSAWNPALIQETALPCCHSFFQFISYDNGPDQKRSLTLKLTMRSCDFPVGAPANMMQYAMLAHMVAHITNHNATKLVMSFGDAHIYEDQIALVHEQLAREPMDVTPTVSFDPDIKELHEFNFSRIKVSGYEAGDFHPAINYPVAV